MSQEDVIREIIKANIYAIQEIMKEISYDVTKSGIIKGTDVDNTYKVEIDNIIYDNVPSLNAVNVGDIVKVMIPQNNYKNKFILGKFV